MPRITYLAPDTDAYVASVQRHVGEFADATGIEVDIEIVESDRYFSNAIHDRLGGESPADVFMSGPVLLWEHVGAGFVEPLDPFVEQGSDSWDLDDFLAPVIHANRWEGRFREPLGAGPLLEIPVNCESYNLAYLPRVLDRYDLEPPETWAGFFETARAIVERSNGAVRGFAQRGAPVWHTIYTGYATQVWSYRGRDFDDDGRCVIGDAPVVRASEEFVAALRTAGPEQWLDQRWYELALDFAQGKYGLIVDSDHYVAYYEDLEHSTVAGEVAYAPPPKGPDGLSRPNLWTWSLVMNSRSTGKEAAWRFIEWASSKEFLLRSAFEGNMNPTRASVWDAPEFAEMAAAWGDFAPVARQLAEHDGDVLVTPIEHYIEVGDRWARALRQAYAGEVGVAEALGEAATEIETIVAGSSPGSPTGVEKR